MRYDVKQTEAMLEVAISGDLTFTDSAQFPKVMAALANAAQPHWVFDLQGLSFIDSTGMSLFVHIYDAATANGRKAIMRGAQGKVRDTLERAGFFTLFDVQ